MVMLPGDRQIMYNKYLAFLKTLFIFCKSELHRSIVTAIKEELNKSGDMTTAIRNVFRKRKMEMTDFVDKGKNQAERIVITRGQMIIFNESMNDNKRIITYYGVIVFVSQYKVILVWDCFPTCSYFLAFCHRQVLFLFFFSAFYLTYLTAFYLTFSCLQLAWAGLIIFKVNFSHFEN